MADPPFLVRVTDIKQWFYCPRVVYFTYLMPVEKKITPKMEFGLEQHEIISALERRRKLREYGIQEGQRLFHVPLRSSRLGLSGILDLLLVTDKTCIPVEFKDTTRVYHPPGRTNHSRQLAGYALLVEERYSCAVEQGFIYQIPTSRIIGVRLTDGLKAEVRRAITDIHAMIAGEAMPDPPPQRGKCTDCEFLRFCGDRF